ncbi:hypothetical protein ACW0KB_19835 [Virgibacillus salarius]
MSKDHEYFNMAKSYFIDHHLGDNALSQDTLEEVIKFHQSSSWIPLKEVHNINHTTEKSQWVECVLDADIIPKFNQEVYKLNSDEKQQKIGSSEIDFDKGYEMSLETLGRILINSFGRKKAKRYESTDDIYISIPILLVFNNNAVKGLQAGTYVFNETDACLLRIKEWGCENIEAIAHTFSQTRELPSYTAIAYALDMRKATILHGIRGYRHGLFEIGAMKQSLREAIWSLDKEELLVEHCWTDFADNMVTHVCGTNIRLAPITLIQWFGKKQKGEANVS